MTGVERIETDPAILGGQPVVRGTRVPVHIILSLLGAGYSTDHVLEEYPQLEQEDVAAALQHASLVIRSPEWFAGTNHERSGWLALAETSLGRDWTRLEEDEAWSDL